MANSASRIAKSLDRVDRVSVASDGTQAEGGLSFEPSISANGRYVAYTSDASNLVPGDSIGTVDIFVFDTKTGTTERVSMAGDGAEANGPSRTPAISADGRYVAFISEASNLVTGDTSAIADAFVFDRKTGVIERLSVAPDGSESNGATFDPAISSHGDFVAYASEASNLVPDDTNGTTDIFVFDRNAGLVERISVSSEGGQANGPSFDPAISADGRYIAYFSTASNLVPDDTNGVSDIFVFDRKTGSTERISVPGDGGQADGFSLQPTISSDGRYVTYYSTAANLVAGDTNGVADIFVFDRKTGVTERISGASGGGEGNGASFDPVISASGRYVTYYSTASNLVSDDTNGTADVFIFDRKTGVTERVSLAGTGEEGNGASFDPAVSANGGYVVYSSDATNLVGGDTNAATDVFLAQTRGWLV